MKSSALNKTYLPTCPTLRTSSSEPTQQANPKHTKRFLQGLSAGTISSPATMKSTRAKTKRMSDSKLPVMLRPGMNVNASLQAILTRSESAFAEQFK